MDIKSELAARNARLISSSKVDHDRHIDGEDAAKSQYSERLKIARHLEDHGPHEADRQTP